MKFSPTVTDDSHSQSVVIVTRTNVIERQFVSNPEFNVNKKVSSVDAIAQQATQQ
jgi:hypothetical protein